MKIDIGTNTYNVSETMCANGLAEIRLKSWTDSRIDAQRSKLKDGDFILGWLGRADADSYYKWKVYYDFNLERSGSTESKKDAVRRMIEVLINKVYKLSKHDDLSKPWRESDTATRYFERVLDDFTRFGNHFDKEFERFATAVKEESPSAIFDRLSWQASSLAEACLMRLTAEDYERRMSDFEETLTDATTGADAVRKHREYLDRVSKNFARQLMNAPWRSGRLEDIARANVLAKTLEHYRNAYRASGYVLDEQNETWDY